MTKPTIHLIRSPLTTACDIHVIRTPEKLSGVSAPDYQRVTCQDCRDTVAWKELAGIPNPRGAGAKKDPHIVKTQSKVTVWSEDLDRFEKLPSKAEFIRNAIHEKFERESIDTTN